MFGFVCRYAIIDANHWPCDPGVVELMSAAAFVVPNSPTHTGAVPAAYR